MKFLKRTGIVLLVIITVYVALALVAPSAIYVERSDYILRNPAEVFEAVNHLPTWKQWSYWDRIDKNMRSVYTGPESGAGAVHSWQSENDSVGNGTLSITRSVPTSLVELKLEFEGMGASLGGWKFKDSANGTSVTTYMEVNSPFIFRPMFLFMDMEAMLGSDFEKSLSNLKDYCEGLPMAHEFRIEQTDIAGFTALTILDSCTSSNISQKLAELYGKIMRSEKAGPHVSGAPFAIYHKVKYLPDGTMHFVLEAGLPVEGFMGRPGAGILLAEIPSGKVVKASHYGAYDTSDSHDKIENYLQSNDLQSTGSPWEVYVTDPMSERDTSKWLTEIYYPIAQ